MNLTKFIHTKKIKQFNSISKTLLTIATCYCNLGKLIIIKDTYFYKIKSNSDRDYLLIELK